MSQFERLRIWQRTEGVRLFEMESLKTQALVRHYQPGLTVQIEGRSYLDRFPNYGYYYHISENADLSSPGYSVEAEAVRLPFADRSVDFLILGHALELLDAHDSLYEEFDRVLASDGVILIHAWAGYWLSSSMPKVLHPVEDLSLTYLSLSGLSVASKHFHWHIAEKFTWVLSPGILKIMQKTVVQPMSVLIEREDLAFVGPGVLRYD